MVKGSKTTAPTSDGVTGALAVVATLYGMIFVAMKNGPCMNPAVALAFTILEVWQTANKNGIYTHYFYAYTLGPAIGGMLAGLFALGHRNQHDKTETLAEAGEKIASIN